MVISIFCRIDEYLGAKDWQEVVEKVIEVLKLTKKYMVNCYSIFMHIKTESIHRIHIAY